MKNFMKQLKQGDIIMYHSHSLISRIINNYDQSNYSHCSVYDKDGFVYESITKGGVQRKAIEDSLKAQKAVLITAFRVADLDQSKTKLLIEAVKKYSKNTYAYSQALLLTCILWKRNKKINGWLNTLTNHLFLLLEKIIFYFIDSKERNMICSELIYRIYMDVAHKTKDTNFILHIPLECNPIFVFEDNEIHSIFPCDPYRYEKHNKDTASAYKKGNIIVEKATNSLKSFFSKENYALLSLTKHSSEKNKTDELIRKSKKVIKILKKAELYNFITPGDIVRSLDTYPVATYKTDSAQKYKKCKVCSD